MSFTSRQVGASIREVREVRGLRQLDLARKIGMTQAAISQYEHGVRLPPPEVAQEIAKALGVSTTHLFGIPDKEFQLIRLSRIAESLSPKKLSALLQVAEAISK